MDMLGEKQVHEEIFVKKAEIHKFEFKGSILALHVMTNRVYLLDRIMSDIVDVVDIEGELTSRRIKDSLLGRYSLDEIERSIEQLLANKLVAGIDTIFPEEVPCDCLQRLRGLEINVSEKCNFGCKYCTAGQAKQSLDLVTMSQETALAAIDLLIEESKDFEEIFIRFNGGEPLLNFETIEEAVSYAKRKGALHYKRIGLQLLTNGSLVNDRIVSFLRDHRIRVQISIDGPQAVHDSWRVDRSGKGTHRRVVENVTGPLSSCAQHMVGRATFTSASKNLCEIIDYLAGLGFGYVVVEPVFHKAGDEYGMEDQDICRLKEEYDSLAQIAYSEGLQGRYLHIGPFLEYIRGFFAEEAFRCGCGAGRYFLGVSGNGDLYPCSEFARQKVLCVGNVYHGIDSTRISRFLSQISVSSKPACKRCWARHSCGGGCHAMTLQFTGHLANTLAYYCDLMQRRLELSMWLYHRFLAEKPDIFYDLVDDRTRWFWLRIVGDPETYGNLQSERATEQVL